MDEKKGKADAGGVAAVDRALAITDVIARHEQPMSLADISRATGFYKSTCLRLISSLERAGLVVRREQHYSLGVMAFRLGQAFEKTYGIEESVNPALQWLIRQDSESASFHVVHDESHRICLLRIDSDHPTLDRVRVGDILPLDAGAAGRILRNSRGLPASRNREIAKAHVSYGERDPSCAAVAAPVFGAEGVVVGAISVSGPRERFSDSAVAHMSEIIVEAAAMATEALGGSWPGKSAGI